MLTRLATIISLALLVLSLVPTSPAQGRSCSATAEAGDWAFTYSGTIILPTGPVPVASSGRFTSKSDGTLSGSQTRSIGGQVADETITGTATVNPDCTEVLNVEVFFQGTRVRTATLNIVYDDDGRAARGIFASLALADGTVLPSVITVDARKIFSGKN